MSTCPKCRTYYREPEDEQGEHPCPRCGEEPMPDLDEIKHPMSKEQTERVMEVIREAWPVTIGWEADVEGRIYEVIEAIRQDWEG